MHKRESAEKRKENGAVKTFTHVRRKFGLDREMNEKIRKRNPRPTKEELEGAVSYYKDKTKEVSNKTALDILMPDTDGEPWHFFRLLMIAENERPLGKSAAILFAFKLGYLAGKGAAR